jgi:hypothetical protein
MEEYNGSKGETSTVPSSTSNKDLLIVVAPVSIFVRPAAISLDSNENEEDFPFPEKMAFVSEASIASVRSSRTPSISNFNAGH